MDKPESEYLADCYYNSLKLAEKENIESTAFPAISTGAFGYPLKEAAEISLKAVNNAAQELKKVKLIRFVLYSSRDLEVYQNAAEKILNLK